MSRRGGPEPAPPGGGDARQRGPVVVEYITKPHDRQELLRAVAKHLGKKHAAEHDEGDAE